MADKDLGKSGVRKYNGHNLQIWSNSIMFILNAKGLWKISNSKEKEPPLSSTEHRIWLQKARKAIGIIYTSVREEDLDFIQLLRLNT